MRLSEIKEKLKTAGTIAFQLPDGSLVPPHFHVTEIGLIHKRFIDCGGTVREEKVVNFQLWQAEDYDHRLSGHKLIDIIGLSENALGMADLEIEVEYQGDTISKYGLTFEKDRFLLTSKQTNCLAPDKCGIPQHKSQVRLSDLGSASDNLCNPDSGCC